jgi:hypothetical protein
MRLALPLSVYRVTPLRWLLSVTVWRLLERESGTNEPDTYGSPNYKYGKVTDLHPDLKVTTETSETPYVCCGYCSAAMACRTARTGLSTSMSKTAHPIRSAAGRPHDNGNNASELRNGAKEAHGVTLSSIAISEIPNRLREDYAVTVGLQYAELPDYLKVQGNDFGHACCLFGWKEDGDYVGFFDPLWPQDARGAWAKWTDVKAALWSDGNHSTTKVKLTPAEPEPEPDKPPEPKPLPPAPGYDVGYAKGKTDGSNAAHDAVFASWLIPTAVSGGVWDSAVWDHAAWSVIPIPVAAVAASAKPAKWSLHNWAGGKWVN